MAVVVGDVCRMVRASLLACILRALIARLAAAGGEEKEERLSIGEV